MALLGLVPLVLGIIVIYQTKTSLHNQLVDYIKKINRKVKKYNLQWDLSSCGGYLHLCIDYANHFEP